MNSKAALSGITYAITRVCRNVLVLYLHSVQASALLYCNCEPNGGLRHCKGSLEQFIGYAVVYRSEPSFSPSRACGLTPCPSPKATDIASVLHHCNPWAHVVEKHSAAPHYSYLGYRAVQNEEQRRT